VSRTVEERITDLAARQHGLVTRAQLLAAGLGPGGAGHRVRSGRLRPVHCGVYRIGPLVSPQEGEMAGVLACGSDAWVSDGSAAALWSLLPAPGGSRTVDITRRSCHPCRRPRLRVHSDPGIRADEVTTVLGIPATTPARTVFDLAAVVGARDLEQALARAAREGLATLEDVRSLMQGRPRRRGAPVLRVLLAQPGGPAMTKSKAEDRFLELIAKGQLPRPETNVDVGGYEVDALWRTERLVVEVDGFAFHASRERFENDRRRDARLTALGYQVMRVTWRQMVEEPEAMLVRLARALATRSGWDAAGGAQRTGAQRAGARLSTAGGLSGRPRPRDR
jgi:very-short-patch-repair endonuclease